MKKFSSYVLTCLFLLIPGLAFAADPPTFVVPEQKIVGVDKPIPLGELVDISVSPIKDKPDNLKVTSIDWKVLEVDASNGLVEKKVRITNDTIMFGAGIKPKKLVIIVAITHLYINAEKVTDEKTGFTYTKVTNTGTRTALHRADVIIGNGEVPKPDPSPGPTPQPNVVLPQGKYGLAQLVYGLAMAVPEESRVNGAAALSSSFTGIAAAINANTIQVDKDILAKTKQANNEALKQAGVSETQWTPFFTTLMNKVFVLYQEKKIVTKDDYAVAWKEIVVGLQAIK
jgi:hypothetical protein